MSKIDSFNPSLIEGGPELQHERSESDAWNHSKIKD
ncbi:hypothetical protein sync_1616 [Synechococcus sp. CC9311]|nr:hypothetical protein sync_1616 [Synechococcus sp. CC9311]